MIFVVPTHRDNPEHTGLSLSSGTDAVWYWGIYSMPQHLYTLYLQVLYLPNHHPKVDGVDRLFGIASASSFSSSRISSSVTVQYPFT